MIALLDGNVLIALGDTHHVHHDAAERWFAARGDQPFATCPITQGTLIRHVLRERITSTGTAAMMLLKGFLVHPGHRFWPDHLDYARIAWRGVLGHRQVTDAYLAALAREQKGRLATLDSGLAALHQDVAELIHAD
jgi:toxin-antitoxin system PIN domain toxin